MQLWNQYQKINDCKHCGGTGIKQWFDLDGGTIYRWMKPETKECEHCHGEVMGVEQDSGVVDDYNIFDDDRPY